MGSTDFWMGVAVTLCVIGAICQLLYLVGMFLGW